VFSRKEIVLFQYFPEYYFLSDELQLSYFNIDKEICSATVYRIEEKEGNSVYMLTGHRDGYVCL